MGAHHTEEGLNPLEVAKIIRLGIKSVRAPNARQAARYEKQADKIVEDAKIRKAERDAELEAKRKAKKNKK